MFIITKQTMTTPIKNKLQIVVVLVSLICVIDIAVFPVLTASVMTLVSKIPFSIRIVKALVIILIAISYSLKDNEIWLKICIGSIFCLLSFWFENLCLYDSVIGHFLMQTTSVIILYSITEKSPFWFLMSLCALNSALTFYFEWCMA